MGVTRGALPHVAFTQIRNAWLRDRRVSWKAKGLLGYLTSHAEGYRLSQAQIIREATDGRDAVVTGLRELEAAGYLQRNRDRNRDGGRYSEDEYTLVDPFDLAGNLLPAEPREIRPPYADEPRETHQSGKSEQENPDREIRPIEEQGEKTTGEKTTKNTPPGGGDPLFVEFWNAYPKRTDRAAAHRAWTKVIRSTNPDKIIAAVREYPFDLTRPRYIKHPATWLNAGCWEDDLDAVRAARDDNGHRKPAPYRNPPPGSYTIGDGTL